MNQVLTQFDDSSFNHSIQKFSPSTRAALLFAIPFTVVDAIHYYTAGTAIILSFPILILFYLLCGALAAKFSFQDQQEGSNLTRAGSSAGVRLWLISTVANSLVAVILGFASIGITLLSGTAYLCLCAPLHAIGSAVVGGLGGWIYQQWHQRTSDNL